MRYIGTNHHEDMKLVHFNMFHCHPVRGLASYKPWLNHLPFPQWAVDWISSKIEEWGLSPSELQSLRRFDDFMKNGGGYSSLQSTRVRRRPIMFIFC